MAGRKMKGQPTKLERGRQDRLDKAVELFEQTVADIHFMRQELRACVRDAVDKNTGRLVWDKLPSDFWNLDARTAKQATDAFNAATGVELKRRELERMSAEAEKARASNEEILARLRAVRDSGDSTEPPAPSAPLRQKAAAKLKLVSSGSDNGGGQSNG